MDLKNQWDNKELVINNLLGEIKMLKKKESQILTFKEDLLNKPINKGNTTDNIEEKVTNRKRNRTEFKKKVKINKTSCDIDENSVNIQFESLPNKDIQILIKILLIYKGIKVNENFELQIESIIKKFFTEKKENFDICEDLENKIDKTLQYIFDKNKNFDYHKIINNLELTNKNYKNTIDKLNSEISNNQINYTKIEKELSLISNINNKYMQNIVNLEKENENLKKIKNDNISNVELNNSNLNQENDLLDQILYFKESIKLKDIKINKLSEENKKLLSNHTSYKNEIDYLNTNINKLKLLNNNYLVKIITKEKFINDISNKFEENLNKIKELYDNKLICMKRESITNITKENIIEVNENLSVSFGSLNNEFNNFDTENNLNLVKNKEIESNTNSIQNINFQNSNKNNSNFYQSIKIIEKNNISYKNINLNNSKIDINQEELIKLKELNDKLLKENSNLTTNNNDLFNKVIDLNKSVLSLKQKNIN